MPLKAWICTLRLSHLQNVEGYHPLSERTINALAEHRAAAHRPANVASSRANVSALECSAGLHFSEADLSRVTIFQLDKRGIAGRRLLSYGESEEVSDLHPAPAVISRSRVLIEWLI
jgi:hypothetical protein